MKERKKIKYVQKQPPDKSKVEEKREERKDQNQEKKNYDKAYLVKNQTQQQVEGRTQAARYRQYEPTGHSGHYQPRDNRQNRNPRRGNDRQREEVPRFIEKQSSHCDASCIICSEQIRRRDWIWTCSCCSISMHLKCIKEWIKNINQQQIKQSIHIFNWKCPQCNFEYNQPIPKYYCYCGKHLNPQLDRDLLPHSCGEICDKKRGPYCTHPCPKTCHSGKCPPCEHEGLVVSCQCGKSQRMIKCSEERLVFQCGKKCQKNLDCLKHKCERNCHPGACQPCKKKKMAKCFCGQSSDIIDCAQTSYSCGEICDKQLSCGYHKCQMKCHIGKCHSCPHTPQLQTTCPCGKYSIEMLTGDPDYRQSCADPIPVCGMPCSKKQECGHVCPRSCHEGTCPPCKKITDQSCVCGSQFRKIECSQKDHSSFKCESVCKKKKNCGNHLCNGECCPHRNSPVPADHPCDLNCTKMLNCSKHECGQPCHMGLCKKCPVIYSQPQPCPCGSTFLRPPITCGTYPPQCENVCGKQLSCGHKCKNMCHYGSCRCVEDVSVTCRCGKEQIPTICGRQALCLTKCQLILPCGHKCGLQCHKGTCEQAQKINPCRKSCTKQRSDCKHLCPQLCHPGQKCEDFPCEAEILVKCDCGHRQTMTLCGAHENHKTKKSIVCNKKCENLKRFDKLYKDKAIYYTGHMVQFAFRNYPYLQNLEARLERFILHSEQNFLEVDYKFQDNNTKLLLTDLFENHYHLNTHYYCRMRHAAFTLMQGEDTMVPKPVLSEYVKLISSGQVKQNNLPFEFTISFEMQQRDKGSLILKSLKDYLHKYYSERSSRFMSLHFWNKEDGESALNKLEEQFQTVDFKCSFNIIKEEEKVASQQIVEVQDEQTVEKPTKIKKTKTKTMEQPAQENEMNKQEVSQSKEVKEERDQNLQKVQGEDMKEKVAKFIPQPVKGKKIPSSSGEQKKTRLIVRRGAVPTFQKNDYPPAKDNVQDIYLIDEQELFGEKVDWGKFVESLCSKKMGPEATEWRLRSLLIINSFYKVKQNYFHDLFNYLVDIYNKDKEKTMRILEIQRIDGKAVKTEMEANGAYLSHHEPEMLSYLRIYNYLAEQKIQVEFPQILVNTPQFSKTHDILEAVHSKDAKSFYQVFCNCDYVHACSLIPIVHSLREAITEDIAHGGRYPVKLLSKYLLFRSDEELLAFFASNGIVVGTKMSKSTKEEVYVLKEGQVVKQRVENVNFIRELVIQKRDKRYFLLQPEELFQERYLTLSFFVFGDFKESVNPGYMASLVKALKSKE